MNRHEAPVHHISCGRGIPLGAKLFPRRFQGHMECHCLLVSLGNRFVLVDSGLSEQELEEPTRLGMFAHSLGLQATPERAAHRQLAALGIEREQVTDIVLTHLDLDHAGGLADFPEARVHTSRSEYEAAHNPRSRSENMRYRPEQWVNARWELHKLQSQTAALIPLVEWPAILSNDFTQIRLIPLGGHTRGHCGVLVEVIIAKFSTSATPITIGQNFKYLDRSLLESSSEWLTSLGAKPTSHALR